MIVYIEESFSAAHRIRGYNGNCESLHGHNFKVKIEVEGKIKENGMVIDFRKLRKILKEVIETLNHKNLDITPPFDKLNPTSENIAVYIFEEVRKRLEEERLLSVQVEESQGNGVIYKGEER